MAWTNPKTWVTNDPLIASDYNTQFRDNLNALRAQTQDMQPKVNALYPGVYQTGKLFKAVIGINSAVSLSAPSSLTAWHDKVKLTFTPQTDEVLFSVQLVMRLSNRNAGIWVFNFGLRKGSANVSQQDTAVISGDLGSTEALAIYSTDHRNRPLLIRYDASVPVTRNAENTVSPTVAITGGTSGTQITLNNPSRVVLGAVEIGVYG